MSRVVSFDEGQVREARASSMFQVGHQGVATPYEVELSADELLALRQPRAIQTPTTTDWSASADASQELTFEFPITSETLSVEPEGSGIEPPTPRTPRLVRIGIGAVTLVAIVATVAVYASVSNRTAISRADVSSADVQRFAPALPNENQRAVRFANPFDRTEVFEFPPGTTVSEARERVAETLVKRAQARAQEYAGVRRNKHSTAAQRQAG